MLTRYCEQFLEVPAPYDEALSAVAAASDTSTRPQLPIRYSARWLAISRAMHPYLCLSRHQMPALPEADDRKLCEAVAREERWVQENLLSGSARKGKRKATWPAMADGDTGDASTDEMMKTDAEDEEATSVAQPNDCEESLDPLDIRRVQMFVRTAPSPNEPGGTHPGPRKSSLKV